MRGDLSRGGRWLAGAGLTAVFGYLTATVAVGGQHPAWPYFLFGAMVVLGFGLHFTGQRAVEIRAPRLGSSSLRSASLLLHAPKGQFAGLRDGGSVDHQEMVSGVVTDFPPGTQAWILVRPVQAPNYWPQRELLLDQDGGFRSVVYFGQSGRTNVGEEFILLLVLATPPASTQFRAFLIAPRGGMQELPQDLKILDQLTVRRR